jgi:hypothetical protein
MRFITPGGRRMRAVAAALATIGGAGHAAAQYVPYPPAQQQQPVPSGAVQQRYPTAQPQYAYGAQQPATPQYAAQGAYQGYQGYGTAQPTAFTQMPSYATPYQVPRTAMAFQDPAAGAPATGELPLTPPAETVPPGALQGGAYTPTPAPTAENYGYGPTPSYAAGGYESYPAAGGAGGCATGACGSGYGGYGAYGGCSPTPYGACDSYSTCGGMSGCLSKHAGCGYWFGGVYGLLMDRDNANKYPLVFTAPDAAPYGYYPASSQVVLRTRDADIGFQPGVEFRLGRTFGCAPAYSCDPCGGCGGCGPCLPRWGLEGVYWTIFEDDDTAYYVDQATIRTYSMMPMSGLEYNPGTGYRPANEYFDYAPPTADHTNGGDIVVTLARVHSSFQVQNVEVNLLRLGVCGGGLYGPAAMTAACGVGQCGGSAGYGCDSGACGYSSYGGCGKCCPTGPRYSCTGVCGFRWMQFDEDFMYGVDFYNMQTTNTGFLNYWSTVQNNLFGAQIGCNGMYRIGCRWGLHLNTLVGLYGNDIDVRQYMTSPTGQVRFVQSGEDFDVRAYKTDVSMIGELRLGASYQYSCHCRLYGGWRAIGVSGIALATDQAPIQFLDATQLSRYVNSNGSLILHGLQAGVEWNY